MEVIAFLDERGEALGTWHLALSTWHLKKLAPEEAKKFLLHHANLGDQGAKEILALVRPTDASK